MSLHGLWNSSLKWPPQDFTSLRFHRTLLLESKHHYQFFNFIRLEFTHACLWNVGNVYSMEGQLTNSAAIFVNWLALTIYHLFHSYYVSCIVWGTHIFLSCPHNNLSSHPHSMAMKILMQRSQVTCSRSGSW